MDLSTWKQKHDEWTKARDRLGVKSGYVKDVSIGDGIDNVCNEWKKGLLKLQAALKELRLDIGSYKAAVRAKYPGAADWLEKNLEKSTIETEEAVMASFHNGNSCVSAIELFKQNYSHYNFPDGTEFLQVIKQNPDNWATASAPLYNHLRRSASNFRQFATELEGFARKMTIVVPGKVQAADFLEQADRIGREAELLLEVAETQNVSSAAFQDKARYCRDSYTIIRYGASQLIKKGEAYLALPPKSETPKTRINFPKSG